MLYFAYGSNLDWERITQSDRAPSAQFLLRATLPNFTLAFTRWSKLKRTGTADVVPSLGSVVWGAVFHIDPSERHALDVAEGVNSGAYRPETVTVFAENDSRRPLLVLTYTVSVKSTTHQPPAPWYLKHITTGAERWELPSTYVEELRRIATQ